MEPLQVSEDTQSLNVGSLQLIIPITGYILVNGSLPNPLDIVLVYSQDVFPLDYIIYCGLVVFFIFCSMSGIKNVGIRFIWLTTYPIKVSG